MHTGGWRWAVTEPRCWASPVLSRLPGVRIVELVSKNGDHGERLQGPEGGRVRKARGGQ